MTQETIKSDADSTIVDLAEKFQKSSLRSFPVVQDTDFVGIISRMDVLMALITIAGRHGERSDI
jgi:CBS domain-containing protein